MSRLSSALLAFAVASLSHGLAAQIKVGAHAPAIRTSKVLSPAGTRLTPNLLAGKTVVIDFWATWCGPCVAAMPHMDELESSLDSSKFVFIALDDEDEAVVERFMSKHKVNAIVALDQRGETFSTYHVASRPMTIVINPEGNVALVTQPQELDAKTLPGISNRPRKASASSAIDRPRTSFAATQLPRPASHSPIGDVHDARTHDEEAALSEVILRRKQPAEKDHSISHSADGRVTYIGFEAKELLHMALGVSDKYIEYRKELPAGTFDLTTKLGGLNDAQTQSVMLSILQQGFGVEISETNRSEDVQILKRSSSGPFKAAESMDPTASTSIQQHEDEIAFSNMSIRNIAGLLEGRIGQLVVDETQIPGKYDGVLHWSGAVDELQQAVLKDLGLVVEHGTRSVPYYSISQHTQAAQ